MELLTKQILVNNFNIFLISDAHLGSLMHHSTGFTTMCNMVNSEWNGVKARHNYVIDGGDFCEAITIDDPRFDPHTVIQPIPALQIDEAIKLYKPIKDKMVVMLDGNHPMKLWKYDYMTPRLCYELGAPFGTLSCKMQWVDKSGDTLFRSFHTHGRKGISSAAGPPARRLVNRQVRLQDLLYAKAGDCFLMCRSHTHQLIVMPPTPELYLYDDSKVELSGYTDSTVDQAAQFIPKDSRWYVSTGSFLKLRDSTKHIVYKPADEEEGKPAMTIGVSGYAEAADYDPMELGFAIAEVRNRKLVQVRAVKLLAKGIDVDPPIG